MRGRNLLEFGASKEFDVGRKKEWDEGKEEEKNEGRDGRATQAVVLLQTPKHGCKPKAPTKAIVVIPLQSPTSKLMDSNPFTALSTKLKQLLTSFSPKTKEYMIHNCSFIPL